METSKGGEGIEIVSLTCDLGSRSRGGRCSLDYSGLLLLLVVAVIAAHHQQSLSCTKNKVPFLFRQPGVQRLLTIPPTTNTKRHTANMIPQSPSLSTSQLPHD
eukprot:805906-Rhodomonas_salina.2